MSRPFTKSIAIIARCATLYRDNKLTDCGLNGVQAPYIPLIAQNPGITQDQIAQNLHVNRSNVTRQLALLEENGFITRKRSEVDRRAVEVYPTDKALEVLPYVRESFRNWREELTLNLTDRQIETLEELLDLVAQRAEEIE